VVLDADVEVVANALASVAVPDLSVRAGFHEGDLLFAGEFAATLAAVFAIVFVGGLLTRQGASPP